MLRERVLTMSWNQRHRLGQMRLERAAGLTNPHYTIKADRISPVIDADALAAAWCFVVAEHPLLRSAFRLDDEVWSLASDDPPVVACDTDTFADELTAPFDHERGPVARLVHASDGSSSLVGIAVDHLVSDGWSLATLWDTLREYYELISRGMTVAAREPEESFVAHLKAQQAIIDEARTNGRLDRLDTYLTSGAIPALRLPDRRTGDIRAALTKAHLHERIELALWRELTATATAIQLSGPNLLLAGLQGALAEHTGSSRVGTTTTLANRLRPADQHAIGWYAGKLVVMADTQELSADPHRYLTGWRDSYWTALDHSDIPWAFLLSRSNPEDFGRFTRKPYVTFNFQQKGTEPRRPAGWYRASRVAAVGVPTGSRDCALGTFWFEHEHGVEVDWEYQPAVLGADEVSRIWRDTVKHARRFASVLSR